MIIYDYRKPVEFENGNCVGVTGENLAYTQEFFIKGMRDTTVNFTIHLRFPDGSVNSVIPDSAVITGDGTRLVWNVKKTDIFVHGYFELQLCGQSDDGMIFQTEIVTLYADESLAVEDKEYANPNAETLQLRDEANRVLSETAKQQKQIEENYKLITQTDLSLKENSVNKVSTKEEISYSTTSYPSIEYLNNYYYSFDESYSSDEIDTALDSKADKSTTLAGYGITDAYTKAQVNSQLANRLSNSDGSVLFRNLNAADVIANQIQGGNTKLVRSTDVFTALSKKADVSTVSEGLNTKVDVADVITGFDKLFSNPDKIPTATAVMDYLSGYYYSIDESYNSDEVDTALAQKYDASNVETGSGKLECADETLADKLTATFKYQKIGKFCLLDIQIKATEKIENDVMFDGLPFVAKSASYNACSSNYGNVRSLLVPYGNSKLKLIGGITTTTTVAITVTYRIEN